MDSLRAKNEALEAQIREKQENYKKEAEELQVKNQLLNCRAPRDHTCSNQSKALGFLNTVHTDAEHERQIIHTQARVEALQLELKATKEKIALHLREYQDLLNAKMSLEIEITTYR